jgi:hypothetical protein
LLPSFEDSQGYYQWVIPLYSFFIALDAQHLLVHLLNLQLLLIQRWPLGLALAME